MTFANRWSAFAARLGTSPRQLAILLASAAIAIGIFGGKFFFTPKSAIAAIAQPAPSTKLPENATAAIPEIFLKAIPHWNLAATPARSPFKSPADLNPTVDTTASVAGGTPTQFQGGIVLQATLDRTFAIVNGKTMRVGQTWRDTTSGNTFLLIEVGERNARFSFGNQVIELFLDHQ